MRSSTRSNSGRSASHSPRIANIRWNGWLQKLSDFVRGELRDAGRQSVQHRALRVGESLDAAARLFQFLDIDREPGDPAGGSAAARRAHAASAARR